MMSGRTRVFFHENRRWIAGLVVSLLVLVILGYSVFSIEEEDTALMVDEVFFNSVDMDGTESQLRITVLLTNRGETRIDDVNVRAFIIERDSNLARDEAVVEMGRIEGKTTSEGELSIQIPNNDSYRVEILVFEDSKLTLRGSGTIDLTGVGVASEYNTDVDDDTGGPLGESSGIGMDDDGSGASSLLIMAFCFILIPVIILIIAAIVVKSNQKKKAAETEPERPSDTSHDEMKDGGHRARPLEGISSDHSVEEKGEMMSIEEEDYDSRAGE